MKTTHCVIYGKECFFKENMYINQEIINKMRNCRNCKYEHNLQLKCDDCNESSLINWSIK